MKANKLTSFDSTDETKGDKKGTYERVIDLKKKNPDLKILLAVGEFCNYSYQLLFIVNLNNHSVSSSSSGGWSFGTERFKTMSSTRYNRNVFIFSAMDYLRQRNFDGKY